MFQNHSHSTYADDFINQAYLYDHDGRFFVGWRLDTSWILCTVSWSLQAITIIGIVMAAYLLPEEGGYELIPGEHTIHS